MSHFSFETEFLLPLVNDAVMPVWLAAPLIAVARPDRSCVLVTAAEIATAAPLPPCRLNEIVPAAVDVELLGPEVAQLLAQNQRGKQKQVGFPLTLHTYNANVPEATCKVTCQGQEVAGWLVRTKGGIRRTSAQGLWVFYPAEPWKRGVDIKADAALGGRGADHRDHAARAAAHQRGEGAAQHLDTLRASQVDVRHLALAVGPAGRDAVAVQPQAAHAEAGAGTEAARVDLQVLRVVAAVAGDDARHTRQRLAEVDHRSGGAQGLGRDHVDHKVVSTLRRRLSDADKRQLQQDLRYAPTWVGNVMRQVVTPSVK